MRRLHLFLEVISMDKRLKEIVDNFDSMKIGVDEPFRFHCTINISTLQRSETPEY